MATKPDKKPKPSQSRPADNNHHEPAPKPKTLFQQSLACGDVRIRRDAIVAWKFMLPPSPASPGPPPLTADIAVTPILHGIEGMLKLQGEEAIEFLRKVGDPKMKDYEGFYKGQMLGIALQKEPLRQKAPIPHL